MMKKLLTFLSCLFLSVGVVVAQDITATGTVVDEAGMEVIGATVVLKGTSIGVATNVDGQFSIKVPEGSTLVFTMVGLSTVEKKAAVGMKVVMETATSVLDEVMVVAYGTAKKSSFTGSAGVVKANQIQKMQVSSVSKALEGAVAGLQVASDGGQPGSNATIRVRGYGSIAGGNSPLLVVDGIIFDGNLNTINSQDIESITVLKDAASSALYGSRAANGVLLVTTKKGTLGKPKVSFEIRQGINVRGQQGYDVIDNTEDYLNLWWTALYNEQYYSQSPVGNPGTIASNTLISTLGRNPYLNVAGNEIINSDGVMASGLVKRYPTNDWMDAAYRAGYRQEYNLSISSGTENATSYLSLGYLGDEGIVANTDFKRFTVRENLTYQITKGLDVAGNLSYAYTDQNQIHASTETGAMSNLFQFVSNIAPVYGVYLYDDDGKVQRGANGEALYDYGAGRLYGTNVNPIGATYDNKNQFLNHALIGRGTISYEMDMGLKFSMNVGYDLSNMSNNVMYSPLYGDAVSVGGRVQKYKRTTQTMSLNQLVSYNKTFNNVHNLGGLIGHESYKYIYDYMYGEKTGMFLPDVNEWNNALVLSELNSYRQTKSIESYLTQFLYDYKNKYYGSFSFRRDGSSVFHKDNRWGNFWSVGASWRISEEDIMKESLPELNNLRLRLSYGTSGNDQIMDEDGYKVYKPYNDQYKLVNNEGEASLVKTYKGNPNLTWEKNQVYNAGIDVGFLDSRINLEFDVFYRKSADLLLNNPLPTSTGDSYMPENLADMTNKGFEFLVSADVIQTQDLRWNLTLNGSHVVNKITKLPRERIIWNTHNVLTVGGTIGDFYLIRYAGVDVATGESLWYYKDADGRQQTTTDPTVAQGSRYIAGTILPDLSGGLTSTFTYKDFDFSIVTNFQLGGKVLDSNYADLMTAGKAGQTWHKDIYNAWTPENTNTNVPRIMNGYRNANDISDRFLISASYFNIKNINLGYQLPSTILRTISVASARVSFSIENVGIFTKRKGMDPRQALSASVTERKVFSGKTDYGYTSVRSFSLGLSANF